MKRRFAITLLYILLFQTLSAQEETRAVWVATIGGIDWPHNYARDAQTANRQKRDFTNMLDRLKQININTILLQTRVRGTVIYPSAYEPWDGCMSGVPGKSPGYDPLRFAIEECHKRGMELHAWVVTIPVGKWNALGCKQLRQKYPRLIQKIGPDKLTVIGAEVTKDCEGKSIARIAAERGSSVIDTTFDLLAENQGNAVLALEFCDEALVEKIFCFPHTAIGCDGIGTGSGQPSHPRGYCNHVRMFGVYVREKGLVSWEEGVRKCTSLPADFFGLGDRGYVREGLLADLVIFDRERIGSQADFSDPFREPEGICYVLTDGVIRVDHGSLIK